MIKKDLTLDELDLLDQIVSVYVCELETECYNAEFRRDQLRRLRPVRAWILRKLDEKTPKGKNETTHT